MIVGAGVALAAAFGIGHYIGKQQRSTHVAPITAAETKASFGATSSPTGVSQGLLPFDDRFAVMDGHIILQRDAKIPVTDRGYQFGDGVFISALIEDGIVLLWDQHIQQLTLDGRVLRLAIPPIDNQLVIQLVQRNNALRGRYRLKVMASGRRGLITGAIDMPDGTADHIAMTLAPNPVSGVVASHLLPHPAGESSMPFGQAKTLAHVGRLMIRHRARATPYTIDDAAERLAGEASAWDEAWCVTESGIILESGFANVFWRLPHGDATSGNKHVICTPAPDLLVYIGTSTKVILELMATAPINAVVRYGHYKLDDIPSNANVFRNNRYTPLSTTISDRCQFVSCAEPRNMCCHSNELVPVTRIGDRTFPRDLGFERTLGASLQATRLVGALDCNPSSK